jgi:MarR-like DNA-binding transcriptional regulator SgrR of sgrS sRNA
MENVMKLTAKVPTTVLIEVSLEVPDESLPAGLLQALKAGKLTDAQKEDVVELIRTGEYAVAQTDEYGINPDWEQAEA